MNEAAFKSRWTAEKHIYRRWAEHVVDKISKELCNQQINLAHFLKVPVVVRVKDEKSLVDKAFYRPGKNYSDPYEQIEDKVGARFVVLLLEDINKICTIIENSEVWEFDSCKHFDSDRNKDPLLFTYQSVHYVLRPREEIKVDDLIIPRTTSCELQIRTLLQHAHAELTHDAIYKAKRIVKPDVHRTVAKSMALIETTDEFFTEVTRKLNYGVLQELSIIERLDGIYLSITGIYSHTQKSSQVIWDEFESLIDEELIGRVQEFVAASPWLKEVIKERYLECPLYQQSTILFIFWMMKKRRIKLIKDWPLASSLLEPIATDLGVSLIN